MGGSCFERFKDYLALGGSWGLSKYTYNLYNLYGYPNYPDYLPTYSVPRNPPSSRKVLALRLAASGLGGLSSLISKQGLYRACNGLGLKGYGLGSVGFRAEGLRFRAHRIPEHQDF